MGLNLESKITLNSADFEKGMNRVASSVMSSVKTYALGAIGIVGIEQAFYKTIETSKELVNESKRMGVSVEMLQVLRKAAAGAGVEMETLAGAMEKVNEFRAKALGGGPEAAGALRAGRQLGISQQDLRTGSAQDIMKVIGDKLKTTNPQELAAPLKEVLGRGFGPIIPLLTKDWARCNPKWNPWG